MKKIRNEALILFSEKGYSDVFVGNIATAVGIKAPSLYKHFKGNQEIFDSCVEKFFERMTQIRNELFLPDTPQLDASYETADTEKITEFADVIPSVNGKPVEKIILENRAYKERLFFMWRHHRAYSGNHRTTFWIELGL